MLNGDKMRMSDSGGNIIELFSKAYGQKPAVVSRAPGRLEILGNHTDYNEGLVLSAAVSQATEFALRPIPGNICYIRDFRDSSSASFNLEEIGSHIPGDWSNYVKGVICEIRKRGQNVGAFEGGILSTVPISAGMSSSAALEVSACFAFKEAFEIVFPLSEWAKIGQGSENNYVGVKSGLLDQFTSIFGRRNNLILCDFRKTEVVRTVAMPEGYVFIVADSMARHDLVESDYNSRRESCERTVEVLKKHYPEIKALRDVSPEMLEASKGILDHLDYLRALHVVGENMRVLAGVEALDKGNIKKFGEFLYGSHKSSMSNFENSTLELDCLVELSLSIPSCFGARLSGGGFGGISIHLVREDGAETYCRRLKTAYQLKTGKETKTVICNIGDGAFYHSCRQPTGF